MMLSKAALIYANRINLKDKTKRISYMQFKPFHGNLQQETNQLTSKGYFYLFFDCNIRIIRSTLEQNCFTELEKDFDFTVRWSVEPVWNETYKTMSFYQKVISDSLA